MLDPLTSDYRVIGQQLLLCEVVSPFSVCFAHRMFPFPKNRRKGGDLARNHRFRFPVDEHSAPVEKLTNETQRFFAHVAPTHDTCHALQRIRSAAELFAIAKTATIRTGIKKIAETRAWRHVHEHVTRGKANSKSGSQGRFRCQTCLPDTCRGRGRPTFTIQKHQKNGSRGPHMFVLARKLYNTQCKIRDR